MASRSPFADTAELIRQLRDDIFVRIGRKAQKQALLEWRDRGSAPGLAARFTLRGRSFYNFSRRKGEGQVPRKPAFYASGSLRNALLRRAPKARTKSKAYVETYIKYGGGSLNFLTAPNQRGVVKTGDGVRFYSVSMPPVTRVAHTLTVRGVGYYRSGGSVRGHTARRTQKYKTFSLSARTYAQEFAEFGRDQPWIERRTNELIEYIFRKTALDKRTGGVKNKYLAGE